MRRRTYTILKYVPGATDLLGEEQPGTWEVDFEVRGRLAPAGSQELIAVDRYAVTTNDTLYIEKKIYPITEEHRVLTPHGEILAVEGKPQNYEGQYTRMRVQVVTLKAVEG